MKKLLALTILLLPFTVKAQTPTATINQFMDNWHKAAATADEDVFFGSMTEDGIYLGTDKTEKWTREEMAEWADEHFQKESAWSFTASERDIYFSENGKTAWINEKLDTWMGVCKGTAVLVLKPEGWKIALYDLSVTIDNNKIDAFLELTNED
ncbi:nuclear transport factor 2 family protein [Marivirga harenae]|uniref:nuclear transport factor 2 family protein n=1 Tax=Marivirga harenae TaxID=2010992 RepID=UPI0026E0AF6D|nr:nuclear transport factor 2 family protein [Marivirga harenae]WKV11872.1 nuclear transport factor 2 family protein [Marivirga harenae]|tara:strand:- start:54693 stop:55151 length:459 start_codon:yes stop_codon:yes gene_type:complete